MLYIGENKYGKVVLTRINEKEIRNHNKYLLERYLRSKQLEGLSSLTLKNYKQNISYLQSAVLKRFENMTTRDIKNFLYDYQLENKISNSTLDDMRRVYSSFFNFLDEEDYILKNPVKKIHHIKSKKSIKKAFSEEEIIRLQDSCTSKRDRALIDFLYSTGVRVSELCRLTITDIDFNNKELIVFGKGNKERIVYFDSRTKVHLIDYLESRDDNNDALFVVSTEPHERLTPAGVEYIVKMIGNKAGVKKCHPHRFRRTLATRLINRGMPIEQVQKLLGHTKIDTTLIYAQVDQSNVKSSHERFV